MRNSRREDTEGISVNAFGRPLSKAPTDSRAPCSKSQTSGGTCGSFLPRIRGSSFPPSTSAATVAVSAAPAARAIQRTSENGLSSHCVHCHACSGVEKTPCSSAHSSAHSSASGRQGSGVSDEDAASSRPTSASLSTSHAASLPEVKASQTPAAMLRLTEAERRFRRLLAAGETKQRAELEASAVASVGTSSPAAGERHGQTPRGSGGSAASVADSAEAGWLVDNAHTQALLSAGKFVDAYFAISAILPRYTDSPALEAPMRARRAFCSYALMNYKECVEDCRVAVSAREAAIRETLACDDVGLASGSLGDASLDLLTVTTVCARACVMRESYEEADRMYGRVLEASPGSIAQLAIPNIPVAQRMLLTRERESLRAVRRFRQCVSEERWQEGLAALQGARALIEETPLRVLEAVALLETGAVDAARELLLPYLPTVPAPTPSQAGDTESKETEEVFGTASERALLRCNVDAHYLLTTALLAKVSVFSGRAYMNIAAALLQRCLLVSPSYGPAITLGDYLVRLEDAFALVDTCVRSGDHFRALRVIDNALKLDPANKRICALLLLRRAEVHMSMGRPLAAVDDCTQSLLQDPVTGGTAARTYLLRARANALIGAHTEAAADLATAHRLNPSLTEEAESVAPQPARHPSAGIPRPSTTSRAPRPAPAPPPPRTANPRPYPPRPFPGASHRRPTGPPPQPRQSSLLAPSSPPPQTFYEVLDVPPTASVAHIRQQFKRLTLQYHPDRLVNAPESVQLQAMETFKKINNAHSVLTDEPLRRAYDATLQL